MMDGRVGDGVRTGELAYAEWQMDEPVGEEWLPGWLGIGCGSCNP